MNKFIKMDIQKIISVLEDLVYEDINNEEYWKAIKEAKVLIKELKQALTISTVVEQSEQLVCPECKSSNIEIRHKQQSFKCNDCKEGWAN